MWDLRNMSLVALKGPNRKIAVDGVKYELPVLKDCKFMHSMLAMVH